MGVSEICYSCFRKRNIHANNCPYCGAFQNPQPKEAIHLRPGTLLAGRYLLGYEEGTGGFGIIYRAWDVKLETVVAVKEFFVNRLMTRAVGETRVIVNRKTAQEFEYRKERFLAEARTMAKFGAHRNIPNVFEFFEENGTAYIVMELLEGQALNDYLRKHGGWIAPSFAIMIINEIGNALCAMHEQGIIHRDVAPDNIYICSSDTLRVKLLDLGAAKLEDATDQAVDIIVKPGFSPPEQYDKAAKFTPASDIYALGATLYSMLTGVKPEESTNRKIADNLPSPHEINPNIPENLSNTIMKAMAVERTFRFKTVADFLLAVNGEKKIIPIKKERRRARRRYIGIICAVLALSLISAYVYHLYNSKRAVQVLQDASISVWFSVDESSNEAAAVDAILEDFRTIYPNILIDVRAIPSADYERELKSAMESDNLPTLFESTGLESEILSGAADLEEVLNSEQASDCLFLDQYDQYYTNKKQIPLAIEIPMAFIITSGNTCIDYDGNTFRDIADFGKDTAIAIDKSCALTALNFSVSNPADPAGFWDNDANTCAVLISSNRIANRVREKLTIYQKSFVYYAADRIICSFDYEWSIGAKSGSDYDAAVRLLSWMLGNRYQNYLMISLCSDGQIPINRECFEEKTSQKNYSAIKEIYDRYFFIKQE